MNPYKLINRVLNAKPANIDSDFSAFVSAIPLSSKQLLIEECMKQGVSIYIDDPSEQSAGIYTIFRSVASEAELERRLHAKEAISLSRNTNVIALLALLVSATAFAKPFL